MICLQTEKYQDAPDQRLNQQQVATVDRPHLQNSRPNSPIRNDFSGIDNLGLDGVDGIQFPDHHHLASSTNTDTLYQQNVPCGRSGVVLVCGWLMVCLSKHVVTNPFRCSPT